MVTKSGATITTEEISIKHIEEKRKFLLTKCPDGRPASFELKYTDKWLKENGSHLHRTLLKYNLEPALKDIKDRNKLNLALNSLRAKKRSINNLKQRGIQKENLPDPDTEDFTIDQENLSHAEVNPEKTIVEYVTENIGAKYVKVLKNQEPVKAVWSDRQFCMHEQISPRTLRRFRKEGIDVFFLQKNDPDRYWNSFSRCYAPARHNYNGRKLCYNHYRDLRFGRDIREDSNDD